MYLLYNVFFYLQSNLNIKWTKPIIYWCIQSFDFSDNLSLHFVSFGAPQSTSENDGDKWVTLKRAVFVDLNSCHVVVWHGGALGFNQTDMVPCRIPRRAHPTQNRLFLPCHLSMRTEEKCYAADRHNWNSTWILFWGFVIRGWRTQKSGVESVLSCPCARMSFPPPVKVKWEIFFLPYWE